MQMKAAGVLAGIVLQVGLGIAAGALAVPFSIGAVQHQVQPPAITAKDQAYIDKTFNSVAQDGSKVSGPITHEVGVSHFVGVTATVQGANDKDGKEAPAAAKLFVVVFDDQDNPLTVSAR